MLFLYEEIPQGVRVIRAFGEDDTVVLPEKINEKPVIELGAYAFSDHMDAGDLKNAMVRGGFFHGDSIAEEIPNGKYGVYKDAQTMNDITSETVSQERYQLSDSLPGTAVSGEKLREAVLPSSLKHIGRYAFYNCRKLSFVSFFGALSDVGAGAFTGCHRISRLQVELLPDGSSSLRELLTELPETIRVDLIWKGEKGCFWFPEFFEEGVENTPARILENHVHGSGIRYRNCFQHRCLNMREYDGMFPYAKAWEEQEIVTAMALGRILFPMELSVEARTSYEVYLKEHLRTAAQNLETQRDYLALGQLIRIIKPERSEAESLLEDAAKAGDTQAVSLFMDYLHSHTKTRRKVFEL